MNTRSLSHWMTVCALAALSAALLAFSTSAAVAMNVAPTAVTSDGPPASDFPISEIVARAVFANPRATGTQRTQADKALIAFHITGVWPKSFDEARHACRQKTLRELNQIRIILYEPPKTSWCCFCCSS